MQARFVDMLLSSVPDTALHRQPSSPSPSIASVGDAGDSREPSGLASGNTGDQGALVQTRAAPKKPTKRGRPSKSDPEVWTKEGTETLFTVRYVTAKDEFKRARNHVEVGAAWVLVATLVNKAEMRAYTVTQCKDKIKWLKKKWSMYRLDRDATGNVPKMPPPPCLELMLEHWAPNPGMQNTSLCDASTPHDDDSDAAEMASNEDESVGTARSKRKKTNGECVEEGLRALADGMKIVGEAMKEKASASTEVSITREVVSSLARQEDALQQQTAAIKELIQALRGGN